MSVRKDIYRIDLGLTDYRHSWNLQKKLVNLRFEAKIPDLLLFTEHQPVITMGRASSLDNLLCSESDLYSKNIRLYEVERGGDITFHGPGQLVVYPIIDLNSHGRDLHDYLRRLEKSVISVLNDFGLDAGIKEGLTGVWVDDRKLAAIGVAVSRWITYHGLALNVNVDLEQFKLINPCGITEYPVGSMESIIGEGIDLKDVMNKLEIEFANQFSYDVTVIEKVNEILPEMAEVE